MSFIPESRTIDWTVGVNVGLRGGIPNRTGIYVTVPVESGQQGINTALANCPSGQIVKLGTGTFVITGSVSILSNTTLKGSGPLTLLSGDFLGTMVSMAGGINALGVTGYITGGYEKGSSTVYISGGSALAAGDIVNIFQENESWNYSPYGEQNIIWALYHVDAVSGSGINIWPPLIWGGSGKTGIIVKSTSTVKKNAGIEDLRIYPSTGNAYPIYMNGSYQCWAKNIQAEQIQGQAIFLGRVLGCEVTHFDVLSVDPTETSDGYGVRVDSTDKSPTALAIYNCYFNQCRRGIIASAYKGSVFAYNFTVNEGIYTVVGGGQEAGFNMSHGAEGIMSLWEGNLGNAIGTDKIHGPAAYQTLYRNRLTAISTFKPTKRNAAIWQNDHDYYWNIVGNVIGDEWSKTTGTSIVYQWTPSGFFTANSSNFGGIYMPGYSGSGPAVPFDPLVTGTALIFQNYDYWNQVVINQTTGLSGNYAPSLGWSSKPSWFGNLNWPPFDYNNPALYSGAPQSVSGAIPASYRYYYGQDPDAYSYVFKRLSSHLKFKGLFPV